MSCQFIARGKKIDILTFAKEIGVKGIDETYTISQLKELILKVKDYDEVFAKALFESIVAQREKEEEIVRIKEDRNFELKKNNNLSSTEGTTKTFLHKDIYRWVSKLEEGSDVQTFLSIFEKQVKRLNIAEEDYVPLLLGLVPLSIAKVINQEEEKLSNNYAHIKTILLKLFKCNTETFKKRFFHQQKSNEVSWRAYIFEMRTCLEEWISGMSVKSYDDLKNLILCEKIKSRTSEEFKTHYFDRLQKISKTDELLELIEEFEAAKLKPLQIQKKDVKRLENSWKQHNDRRGSVPQSSQPQLRSSNYWMMPRVATSPPPRHWAPRNWIPQPRTPNQEPRAWAPPPGNQNKSTYNNFSQYRPSFKNQSQSAGHPTNHVNKSEIRTAHHGTKQS